MLSDLKIRKLKPEAEAFRVFDGEGLYLEVTPSGTRSWRMDYRFGARRSSMALGRYPAMSLREAREARDAVKDDIAAGRDPRQRKAPAPAPEAVVTFRSVAERWIENNETAWVPEYTKRIVARLTGDVFPAIGHIAIDGVTAKQIIAVARSVEDRGAIDMARRVVQMISGVFVFAASEELVQVNPASIVTPALAKRPGKGRRNSLAAPELRTIYAHVLARETVNISLKCALRFTTLTFVRTAETRFATWDEFDALDGDEPLWRIPAERMKMRREHLVPLSRQAVAVLNEMRSISGRGPYVFPLHEMDLGRPLAKNAMLGELYAMGLLGKATVHGFRHTASTWLNEAEFNRDWIEMQLAHVDGGVRGVYNSAQYLRQRRGMMQVWADFLDQRESPAEEAVAPPDKIEMFRDLLG